MKFKNTKTIALFLSIFLISFCAINAQDPGPPPKLKTASDTVKASPGKKAESSKTTKKTSSYKRSDTRKSQKSGSSKSQSKKSKSPDSKKISVKSEKPKSEKSTESSSSGSAKKDNDEPESAESLKETKETAVSAKTETRPAMTEKDTIPFMQKTAPTAARSDNSSSVWLKTIGAVLLVLGLLFAGTWVAKKTGLTKFATGNSLDGPDLKILSSVTPKNGQTISVVQFGDRQLLVGSTAQSFTLLAEETEWTVAENAESESFDFEGRPVSVSELLAKEHDSFETKLTKAQKLLSNALGGILS